MLSNLEIKVNVTFGLTDGLTALIQGMLPSTKAARKQAAGKQPAKTADKASAEAVADTQAKPDAPEQQAPADTQAKPKAEPKKADNAAPTAEDVRAAMRETRRRIEGEDYSTNPESAGYKTFHRQLTQKFLTMAQMRGADKPSMLDEAKRASFISECADLIAGDDGTIKTDLPF